MSNEYKGEYYLQSIVPAFWKKEITVVDLKIAAELMLQDGKNMQSSFFT